MTSCSGDQNNNSEEQTFADFFVYLSEQDGKILANDCAGSGIYLIDDSEADKTLKKSIKKAATSSSFSYLKVQLLPGEQQFQVDYPKILKPTRIEEASIPENCDAFENSNEKFQKCLTKLIESEMAKEDTIGLREYIFNELQVELESVDGNSFQLARSVEAKLRLDGRDPELIDLWQSPEGVDYMYIHSRGYWEELSGDEGLSASPKTIKRYISIKAKEQGIKHIQCGQIDYPLEQMLHGNWFLDQMDTTGTGPIRHMPNKMNFDLLEGRAQGYTGCNRFGFALRVSGDSIVPVGIAMTQRYCPQIATFEDAYIGMLGKLNAFRLKGGKMSGKLETGEEMLFRGPSKYRSDD